MINPIRIIVQKIDEIFRTHNGAVVLGKDATDKARVLKTNTAGELIVETGDAGAISAPTTYTVVLVVANQQYSLELPVGAKAFSMQARQNVAVRFAFVTGKVAGSVEPYATMKAGAPYGEVNLEVTAALPIYFASTRPNTDVELVVWG